MPSRILRVALAPGILAMALCTVLVNADEADVEALGKLNEAYVTAFNQQEPQKVAELFTPDGDLLMLTGILIEGRQAIAGGHAAFFGNNPRAKLSGKQLKQKFLSPDLVLAHGEWQVANGPGQFPGKGLWIAVAVKKEGTWRYETLRLLVPIQPGKP